MFDLNRRYFKITDVVLFEDNKVKLDVLPQCYIEIIAGNLLNINIGTVLSTDKPSLEITLRALLLKKYFLQAPPTLLLDVTLESIEKVQNMTSRIIHYIPY